MGQEATPQEAGVVSFAAGHAVDLDALRRWDVTVDVMARTSNLVTVSRLDDRSVPGHTHEYLAQYFAGIPVHGGGVSRQLDDAGVTVSLFGTLHRGIDVDAAPTLSGTEVAALVEALLGGRVVAGREPSLSVLSLPDGSYALAYRVVMSDGYFYFADAGDGRLLHRTHAFKSQAAAVGVGTDFLGNRRKVSTSQMEARFQAYDRLRPAEHVTLDIGFDIVRFWDLLIDHFRNFMEPGERIWTSRDVAVDADNEWDDAAVVGAHAYTGWTYDYFFERHGWGCPVRC